MAAIGSTWAWTPMLEQSENISQSSFTCIPICSISALFVTSSWIDSALIMAAIGSTWAWTPMLEQSENISQSSFTCIPICSISTLFETSFWLTITLAINGITPNGWA